MLIIDYQVKEFPENKLKLKNKNRLQINGDRFRCYKL